MKLLWTIIAQGIQLEPNEIGVPQGDLGENNISNALRLVFGLAGGVALLIVTVAGFKYVLSQGNPQETAKAKNTILYALIGLVVCIMAFSIVGFVVGNL
jgi:uncharacterized membrane protein YidH (DUF202 family)